MDDYLLVLYYSAQGATQQLAQHIARGIQQAGMEVKIRTVPKFDTQNNGASQSLPDEGHLFATHDDLRHCKGLALGSPTRFGNMAAPLKHFLDSTSNLWLEGALIDKPAMVFTSSDSLHGGQETTLFTMSLPLLHHGMILVGVPYTQPQLSTTKTGGTPYGPTHVNRLKQALSAQAQLSEDEKALALESGRRLSKVAQKLIFNLTRI